MKLRMSELPVLLIVLPCRVMLLMRDEYVKFLNFLFFLTVDGSLVSAVSSLFAWLQDDDGSLTDAFIAHRCCICGSA